RLLAPVQGLLGTYSSVVTAGVSLGRVFELLDTPVEIREKSGAALLGAVRGEIEFDSVVLRLPRPTPAPSSEASVSLLPKSATSEIQNPKSEIVLNGASFHISAGSICGIVGPSGVGKSTIADMLLRFYDPEEGAVRLDGVDLRDLRLADLRQAVALVDQ